jgi:hypothetical protein
VQRVQRGHERGPLGDARAAPPASSFDGLLSAATEEVEHLPDYGDCVDDDVESATTTTTAIGGGRHNNQLHATVTTTTMTFVKSACKKIVLGFGALGVDSVCGNTVKYAGMFKK